ncbi:Nonribosomal peptide synthetase GRA1 [Cladobotryum mycophilum]|uniref:Nonribosomal peptide synthetase GRA1 n=1 Tax=Cladobotryum mycophilum TaxID=491253 RepID=A0ABR0SVY9_9HYPO
MSTTIQDQWKPIGDESCLFPVLNTCFQGEDVYTSITPSLEAPNTPVTFCHSHGIEPSRLLQLAWCVVLRLYAGSDRPFFSYYDQTTESTCTLELAEDQDIVYLLKSLVCWDEKALAEKPRLNTAIRWNSNTELPRQFDISVEAQGSATAWTVSLQYKTSVLSTEQATLVADLFQHVTNELVLKDRLSSVELCPGSTIEQLSQWNSYLPEEIHSCIHELVLEHCRNRPEAQAVCAWDGDFTYQDIDRLSTILAKHLQQRGLRPEKFIGIYFEKSKWMVIALLAVIRAGGAFILLDPSHPPARLKEICSRMETLLVLSSRHLAVDAAADLELDVIPVDEEQLEPFSTTDLAHSNALEDGVVQPNNALFAVFTSGSTGTPKGITINHISFCSGQKKLAETMGINSSSRVLQFAAFAFDLSIQELLTTLLAGGTVCILSESARRSNISMAISDMRVNLLSLTPTVARLLDPSDIPSVTTVQLVGEPVLPTDVENWASHVRLFNGYGPAECCMCATVRLIPNNDRHPAVIGSGNGSLCWVTDPLDPQKLAPIGAIGELLIEGPIVGRGYVKDAEKTVASFIFSPRWRVAFAGNPNARMYRTGDLVQYVSNGELRYVGRRDAQTKLRGQRLELNEIEHHLRQVFPVDVQAVADIVVPANSNNQPILVGFILLTSSDEESNASENDILASPCDAFRTMAQTATSALVDRLPRFMVPSVVVQLSAIPRTASGKTDRAKLRKCASVLTRQELERFSNSQSVKQLPVTPAEHLLCKLITEVLQVTDFGMNDDFFKLGGDSVLVMELNRKARQDHRVHLPGDAIFKSPVLSDVALAISKSQIITDVAPFSLLGSDEAKDDMIEVVLKSCHLSCADDVEDIYPCTPLQEGIMALSLVNPLSDYTTRSVFRLPRVIGLNRLTEAWNTVIRSNPVLRTRIVQTKSGHMLQVVVKGDLAWHAAKSLDECVREDEQSPFQLGDPLLRLAVVQSSEGNFLSLKVHHTLYDGWSFPRTLAQVEASYYGDKPQSQPFNTFVSYLVQQDVSKMEDFWRKELDDFSAPLFPNTPSGDYNYRPTEIQSMKRSLPIRAARDLGFTLATVVKLSWAMTTSQYSGSDDVVFGTTLAGRNVPVPGIDLVLGPTITTVPLRIKLQRTMSVRDMLELVHEQSIRVMDFEQAGLQRIATTGSGAAAACRFQCLLIVQPVEDEDASTIFTQSVKKYSAENADSYILTLETHIGRDGTLQLHATYDAHIIPESLMSGILSQFHHNLSEVVDGLDKELGQLNGLNPTDLQTIYTWNYNLPEAVNCCIHDMVTRQFYTDPQKTAVAAWDGNLTYEELVFHANNLAAKLQGLGVVPGDYIMIYIGKSLWVVVAMMAVLRAGGAFVLIDPVQPLERLQKICEDTDAKMVIATEQHLANATALGLRVVKLGRTEDCASEHQLVEPAVTPGHTAYSVFTSGSTGRPKGVIIQHHAFVTSALGSSARQLMNRDSRILQFASFTFDASISEILYTLIIGATVCIPSESDCKNALEKVINDFGITWTTLTPSVARTLTPSKLTTLRTISLGGEAMTKMDLEMWAHQVQLVNGYGPAECSVDTSTQSSVLPTSDPSNIGRPASAVSWIVDPSNPQILKPIGATGELVVEGPILAKGYLKDPVKTAAAFIEYPDWLRQLRHGKSGRLYRTGDLAIYSPQGDGSVLYRGRKDNQVKLRGQRIELGEVEHNLRECLSDAKELFVEIVRPADKGAEPALAAFIFLVGSEMTNSDDVLASVSPSFRSKIEVAEKLLQSKVPNYMIPALFLPLTRVPIAPTGKVNRRLLRETASGLTRKELRAYSTMDSFRRPPSTAKEFIMQRTVAQVLNQPLEDVGMEDNFFQLGGDSITAMRVVSCIKESGFVLTVADVFSYPRLADLALALQEDENLETNELLPFSLVKEEDRSDIIRFASDNCGVDMDAVEDVYPCTPMQEALFALTMKQQGAYIARVDFDLPQDIDMSRLESAWQAVFDANTIMRTRFIPPYSYGGASLQVVIREKLSWMTDSDHFPIEYGMPLHKIGVSQSEDRYQLHLWLHHGLYDGMSLPSILEQAEAAYNGQELRLKPFNIFARYTTNLDMDASRDFWRNEFKDLDATMFPPVRSKDVSGQRISIAHNVPIQNPATRVFTLPAVIHLSCAVVLGHYTQSQDVVYGLTLAGRTAPIRGIENLVGPTITTIPFRVQLSAAQPVTEALSEIQSHLIRVMPHEQFGLQNMRPISAEAASASDFHCHLVIQPADTVEESDLFKEVQPDDDVYSQFSSAPLALIFTVSADKQSIQLVVNFDSSYLEVEEVSNLAHQLDHVIQQVLQDSNTLLQDIEVVSPRDLSRLIDFNATVPESHDRLLHELVFDQCFANPTRQAISSWDGSFTYKQLYDSTSRLAQHFTASGVGSHAPTMLCMEKSKWTAVAMLAILQTGSTCIPIDSSNPPGRIQEVIEQTGAKFIIASPKTKSLVDAAGSDTSIVTVSAILVDKLAPSPPQTPLRTSPGDPAFVLFTSGSTGKPKGMVLEHRSIATALRDLRGPFKLDQDSRVLHFASYSFDLGFYEILASFTVGGCLCIPSDYDRASNLDGYIEAQQVNWAFLIPSATHIINPKNVPSLKTLIMGGEKMKQGDADRWADNKDLTLMDGYGPAECSIVCCTGGISPTKWDLGTIGYAVNGVVWIANPSNPAQLSAWGAIGELFVEGPNVAREYINDPEKTAASFITSPPWLTKIRGHDKSRLYRSGDLVQYTSDGQIRIIGRKDRQVKLNGQRLEPGEIETRLKSHFPSQATIVVDIVTSQAPGARPRLVAFICLGTQDTIEERDTEKESVFASSSDEFKTLCHATRSKLQESLPRYMIPATFVQLNFVPQTSSGKLNRRLMTDLASSLMAEESSRSLDSASERIAPVTEKEQTMVELWADLLGTTADKISTADNFFNLGGDSILSMRLVASARQKGLVLTVSIIFSHPQLSDMAIAAQGQDSAEVVKMETQPFEMINADQLPLLLDIAADICSVAEDDVEDIYPCTPLQEGLISQSLRSPGAFVAHFRYKLPSDVNISLFKEAWRAVIRANPALRTRFIQDESLYQVVLRGDVPWTMVDADSLDKFDSLIPKKEMVLGEPLLQLMLNQPSDGSAPTEFLLINHHSIYDGWSMGLVLEQVQQAYEQQPIVSRPFNRFIDYVVNSDQNAAREYWLQRLDGVSGLAFPQLPSKDHRPYTDSVVKQEFAWAQVVSQFSDSNDVVFGMVLSGRSANVPDIESIVGPAITTVPFRFNLQKGESVISELRRFQDVVATMSPFEQVGLQNIRRLSGDADAACQFQNLLLIQSSKGDDSDQTLMTPMSDASKAGDFSAYALEITCEVSEDNVLITFDFDGQVLDPRQAARIMSQFSHVVQQIQSNLEVKSSELDLIAPSMWEEMKQWNSGISKPMNQCVHTGIKEHCLNTPDAQAVCAWDGDFTYKDLDVLSSRLAVHLQSLGAGPEVFVPILSEKSKWVAIAILGVIKAGGAFHLIDPAIPLQRMQTICDTIEAKLIISSTSCAAVASELAPAVVVVSNDQSFLETEEHADIVDNVNPQNSLYIIFTSGTTGKPKGIVIEHSPMYTSCMAQLEGLRVNSKSRALQFASHMFDVSVCDYLWILLAGGCVCIASQEELRDNLAGAINSVRANRVDLTPSIARVLRPDDVPSIEVAVLSGEAMSQRDVQLWAEKVQLVNVYGPSECSIGCVLAPVCPGSDPLIIGKTVGPAAWIVDKEDHSILSPIGAVGELLIEGETLARGYLKDPVKTAASFIETSPVWLKELRPNARLYKTGDLVHYTADGLIRYMGRKDTQVKIRGQRVELGEIEHQIRQSSPSVRDAVAEVIRPAHRESSQVLVAFICDQTLAEAKVVGDDARSLLLPSSSKHRDGAQRITTVLQDRLPVYMVPGVFIPISFIPVTSNGKADRRLLRQLAEALTRKETESYQYMQANRRPPSTIAEETLQMVVSEILHLELQDIGMEDDFFKLGGDSIIAIRLVERARAHGFTFRVTSVFQNPTLSALAMFTSDSDDSAESSSLGDTDSSHSFDIYDKELIIKKLASQDSHPYGENNILDILPMTQAAERYLSLTPEYWSLNFDGPVDHERIQAACTALVHRHGVLRTVFVQSEDRYLQAELDQIDTSIDYRTTSSDIASFIEEYRCSDTIAVPTLDVPITQFMLVQNTENNHSALVIRLSHTQFDGYCLPILWNDLKQVYDGHSLSDAPLYSSHMRIWEQSRTEAAFAFWREALDGSSVSSIDNTTFGDANVASDSNLISSTRSVSLQSGIPHNFTTATIVKAAWSIVLAKLTGQDNAVFAQVSNGRNHGSPAAQDVVGICLNFIPVRAKLSPDWTIFDLLQYLQRQHHESLDHELIDFRDIVQNSTSWSKGTLPQSVLLHQNIEPDEPMSLGETAAEVACSYDWPHPPDDILIESMPLENGELQLTIDTRSDVLSQRNADNVVDNLCRLITMILKAGEDTGERLEGLFAAVEV